MKSSFEVEQTTPNDLKKIFALFDSSIQYQESKGYPVWKNYDQNAIVRDIENGNQYKITSEGKTGIVFSVCYSDPLMWGEQNKDAVYLHRIVVNPEFKGQKLFGHILKWAIDHAKAKGLSLVRMDTWANNPTIIDYYKSFGFQFLGNRTTPDSVELPVHNRNLTIALLEYKI